MALGRELKLEFFFECGKGGFVEEDKPDFVEVLRPYQEFNRFGDHYAGTVMDREPTDSRPESGKTQR